MSLEPHHSGDLSRSSTGPGSDRFDPVTQPVELPRNRPSTVIGLFYTVWLSTIALTAVSGDRSVLLVVVAAGAIVGPALVVIVLTHAGDQQRAATSMHLAVGFHYRRHHLPPPPGGETGQHWPLGHSQGQVLDGRDRSALPVGPGPSRAIERRTTRRRRR